MLKRAKKFLEFVGYYETIRALASLEFIRLVLWPFVWSLMTGAAGLLGGIPLMWVFLAAALAFMAVAQSILRIDEYKARKNAQNKLAFLRTIVACDLDDVQGELKLPSPQNRQQRRSQQKTGAINPYSPRTLKKIQLGVELRNDATFPISIFLAEAETSVGDKTPPRAKLPKPASTFLPGTVFRVMDDSMDMDSTPCERMRGELKLKIMYGRPGDEKFELNFDAEVDIHMERFGFISGSYSHWR